MTAKHTAPTMRERDPSKPAEQQGLFRKFEVRRTDGSDVPGGKHHGCRYFVLDVDHDKHAQAALTAYAAACESTYPELARDLREKWGARAALSQAEPEPSATDELAALTSPRETRAGTHLFKEAKSLGWKDDGEGAYEFLIRLAYEAGMRRGHSSTTAPGDGWRPIAEAPKDGRRIWIARNMGEPWGWVRGIAYFADCKGISGWVTICAASEPPGVLGLANPTHWQPLPAPPETDSQNDR